MLALFNMGPFEFAIVLLLLLILVYVFFIKIFSPGLIKRIIMRFSEKTTFRLKNSSINFDQSKFDFKVFPLKISFLSFLIVQAIFVFYFSIFLAGFIATIVSFLCFSYSLFIHFQPNHNREKKYNIILFGELLVYLNEIRWLISKDQIFPLLLLTVIMLSAFTILIALGIKNRIAKKVKFPSSFLRISYWIIRKIALIIIIVFHNPSLIFPLVTVPYLILRFLLTEYMSIYPILYLRSFHYTESSHVFSNLIAPVATKYGVIIGLVHEKQKGSDLFGRTNTMNQGQTFTISDEHWQEWVKNKLKRCSVVILDSSVESESIEWETITANQLVDPDRIIILHKEGTESKDTFGNKHLTYSLDSDSFKKARNSLKIIFKDIYAKYQEQEKKAIPIEERP